MNRQLRLFDRRGLLLLLTLLLASGFFATTLFGYYVSREAIRDTLIGQDLPLTSSNIYSEIQKDLVRPVLVSATMAHDTFVRDWVIGGEKNVVAMARYLKEVKERHGAFSSFFVSARSANYYTGDGILKRVSPTEPRDTWYYRVSQMKEDYEINVDIDLANKDALTIFINYRVFDYDGNYLGATGIGLTVDAVRRLISSHQLRFLRTIYFVDGHGRIVLFGNRMNREPELRAAPGIGPLVDHILAERSGSWRFKAGGSNHILHVNYLPELKWYLFVEQNEDIALAGIRKTLYVNFAISLVVTLVVVFLAHLVLSRYQRRLEDMATTDKLTGLLNRQAFAIVAVRFIAEYRREPRPVSVVLVDADRFKEINDRHGHLIGDGVLAGLARRLRNGLRESDIAVRWGGEEFLLLLRGCDLAEAGRIAENLRAAIEQNPVGEGAQSLAVTISIGVAQYDGRETVDQWINRADAALYEAKHSGRNRVVSAPVPA